MPNTLVDNFITRFSNKLASILLLNQDPKCWNESICNEMQHSLIHIASSAHFIDSEDSEHQDIAQEREDAALRHLRRANCDAHKLAVFAQLEKKHPPAKVGQPDIPAMDDFSVDLINARFCELEDLFSKDKALGSQNFCTVGKKISNRGCNAIEKYQDILKKHCGIEANDTPKLPEKFNAFITSLQAPEKKKTIGLLILAWLVADLIIATLYGQKKLDSLRALIIAVLSGNIDTLEKIVNIIKIRAVWALSEHKETSKAVNKAINKKVKLGDPSAPQKYEESNKYILNNYDKLKPILDIYNTVLNQFITPRIRLKELSKASA